MFKVIVERPRRWKSDGTAAARRRDDLDGPAMLGMRAGYGYRALNENLNPLRRYLHAQVGRPWNKVFGEICAHIDRRNTVQQHIRQHIEDFIAIDVAWHDGQWVDLKWRCSQFRAAPGLSQPLFVDPTSGLIRVNENFGRWRRLKRERKRAEEASVATRRRVLDASTMLLKLDECWFHVEVAPLPEWTAREVHRRGPPRRAPYAEPRFDVVLKRKTSRAQSSDNDARKRLYGDIRLYGVHKRQISRREMEQHGLRATHASDELNSRIPPRHL